MHKLIAAWTSAQDVVCHLEPIMRDMGLLSEDGTLNAKRVLLITKKAQEG